MRKSFFAIESYRFWIVLAVTVADFSSKKWIMNHMILYETKSIMPFLNLFYTHNYGIVFGLLSDNSNWQRWLFIILATITILIIALTMFRTENKQKLNSIAYALVIGGAIGNLVDRTWNGFVVDFIDFYIYNWHFATFNIADFCISIGVFVIILKNTFVSDNEDKEKIKTTKWQEK